MILQKAPGTQSELLTQYPPFKQIRQWIGLIKAASKSRDNNISMRKRVVVIILQEIIFSTDKNRFVLLKIGIMGGVKVECLRNYLTAEK